MDGSSGVNLLALKDAFSCGRAGVERDAEACWGCTASLRPVRQMGSRCLTWSAFRPWFVPVSRGWTQKLPLGLTVCWLFLQYAHKQHVLNMLCRMHALLWLAKSYAIPAGMYTCKVWGTSEKFECPSQTAQNCFKGFKGLKAAGRGSSHGGHAPQRFLRSFRVQAFTGQC